MQRGRIEARQPPDDRGGGRGVQNFRRDLIASARLGIDLPRTALGKDLLDRVLRQVNADRIGRAAFSRRGLCDPH